MATIKAHRDGNGPCHARRTSASHPKTDSQSGEGRVEGGCGEQAKDGLRRDLETGRRQERGATPLHPSLAQRPRPKQKARNATKGPRPCEDYIGGKDPDR